MVGVAGEANKTYIRNINTTNVSGGGADSVTVDLGTGLLGHLTSSRRYKEEIQPMDQSSEALYQLKPVKFRYKKEIDQTQALSFGLIAEEVAEVNPDLIARDSAGKPETVRYEAVNAMLLNEFLKKHRKNEKQEETITQLKKELQATAAQQQQQIEMVTAVLQKVSAQLAAASPSSRTAGELELSKFATGRIRGGGPAPQVVNNP
jgi:endosialidase-like protein